jgi:hypothetical protein
MISCKSFYTPAVYFCIGGIPMAEYAGYGGKVEVYVGATTYSQYPGTSPKADAVGANWVQVLEITDASVQYQRVLENTRVLGELDDKYIPTTRGWSGTINGFWDMSTTANDAQKILYDNMYGASNLPTYVKIHITTASAKYMSGWVYIENIQPKTGRDGTAQISISFKGTKAPELTLA